MAKLCKTPVFASCLAQLNKELFVLDIREALTECPEIEGYPLTWLNANTLEVEVEKSQSINHLFEVLSGQGIQVLSMRNKTNRLEELFFTMVEKNLTGESHD